MACDPSPYSPRTARLIFCRLRKTLSICRVMTSAGKCIITLTRTPGADVRGASGEKTELGMKGKRQMIGQKGVDAVDLLPGVLQIEPAVHDLDPQVIFLVDHQADLFAAVDGHAAGSLAFGVFAADQLPLDQELPVDDLEFVDVRGTPVRRCRESDAVDLQDCFAQRRLDIGAVLLAGPADEREVRQIPGQANAAADDDVRLRSGAPQPFAAGTR